MSIARDDALAIAEELDLAELLGGSKVLVTGAAGFLGGHVVEALLASNDLSGGSPKTRVVALAHTEPSARGRFSGRASRDDLEILVQDVAEPLPADLTFDFAVHAASPASPRGFGDNPVGTILANTAGTANVLEAAARSEARSVLFVSTSEIYGSVAPEAIPTPESGYGRLDPLDPRACYAESKRAGEAMCVAWYHQHGIGTRVARPFHVYGPNMALRDGRIFSDLVADVVDNTPLVLHSEGTAVRSYCYARDAIAAFFMILLDGEPGTAYNVGNPQAEISVRDLAQMLCDLFPERNLTIKVRPRPPDDPYVSSPVIRSAPDVKRLIALGWVPRFDLRAGFERTVRSFPPGER